MTVWAVVAHWGAPVATEATVASLRHGTVVPDEVIVVDNQGGYASEGVRVIVPGQNVGFAGAIRLGGEAALQGGAHWLWFLNNDVVVAEDCLARLVEAGSHRPHAALLTPLIEYGDGTLWYAGGTVDARTLRVAHITAPPASDEPIVTGYATGCAVLARADYARSCGLPEAELFMYYEDVEWSLRAVARGWEVVVVPAARARHDVPRRRGRRVYSPAAVYYVTRNRLALARRRRTSALALWPALEWGVRQWVKGALWHDGGRTRRALYAGLRDGLRGRGGPLPPELSGSLQ